MVLSQTLPCFKIFVSHRFAVSSSIPCLQFGRGGKGNGHRQCFFSTATTTEGTSVESTVIDDQKSGSNDPRSYKRQNWWKDVDTTMHKNTCHLVGRLVDLLAPRKVQTADKFGISGGNLFAVQFGLITNTMGTFPGNKKSTSEAAHWIRTQWTRNEAYTDKLMEDLRQENVLVDVRGPLRYQTRRRLNQVQAFVEANDLSVVADPKDSKNVNRIELIGLVEGIRMTLLRETMRIWQIQVTTATVKPFVDQIPDECPSPSERNVWTRQHVSVFANSKISEESLEHLDTSVKKGSTVYILGRIAYARKNDGSSFAHIDAEDFQLWSPEFVPSPIVETNR